MSIEIRGPEVERHRRVSIEQSHYQDGHADRTARELKPGAKEPWEEILNAFEPLSPPCLRWLLGHPTLSPLMQGRVLDVAAGTCWASALISQQPRVREVWAYDLSEKFLEGTGVPMFRRWNGDETKLRFAVGDFNDMPFEDGFFDAGILIACLHHSLSPLITLTEVLRCIRPGGNLFVVEAPCAVKDVKKMRDYTLSISTNVTEIAYTVDEFEYMFRRVCLPFNDKSARFERHPFPVHTSGWRMWARKALEVSRLADIVRPAMSVWRFEVLKAQG